MKHALYILAFTCCLTSCKSPDARAPISSKTSTFFNKSIAFNKALNTKQHNAIKAIIAKNSDINYLSSPHGFWYYYHTKIENDSLKTPSFGHIVNFNYTVSDLQNATIYSNDIIGTQNYTIDKEELFTGLREGLKLMKAGEVVSFIFPSNKAYGFYGDFNKIKRNMPIICKVTLNSISTK